MEMMIPVIAKEPFALEFCRAVTKRSASDLPRPRESLVLVETDSHDDFPCRGLLTLDSQWEESFLAPRPPVVNPNACGS